MPKSCGERAGRRMTSGSSTSGKTPARRQTPPLRSRFALRRRKEAETCADQDPKSTRLTEHEQFDQGVLTVSAERERSDEVSAGQLYRFERRYGGFPRAIGLPQGVSED
jgi:hypothetical protein